MSNDTEAIQSAIDKCSASGGGTLPIPAGVYRCGTLYLRDNVCLHLNPGAIIQADPNATWNRPDCFSENLATISQNEKSDGRHLIVAYKVRNIGLAGQGVVDGNYAEFYTGVNAHGRGVVNGTRPAQMVFFCECENVLIRDVRLVNACYWTLLIYGCRHVHVDGIYAQTAPEISCGDGIDIDASQNVCVSNCIIDTEDDCLTLRCDNKHLENPRDCESVTVTNCQLRSAHASAIRIGVGDGVIKNALFNNIIAKSCICICGRYSCSHAGTAVENLVFSNFIMESSGEAFFISCGYHSQRKCARILFSNMRVRAGGCSYIGGMPDNITEGIVFKDVVIVLAPGLPNDPDKLDLIDAIWGNSKVYWQGSGGAPFAFWIEHARDCRFTDCAIVLEDKQDVWHGAIRLKSTENIDVRSLTLDGFERVSNLIKDENQT